MSALAVDMVLEELGAGQSPDRVEDRLKQLPDAARFAAVGGSKADTPHFRSIREPIEAAARLYGYPEEANQQSKAAFDVEATSALMKIDALRSGETERDDVWAFISSWLLRDVTIWRFGLVPGRFHGGVRNAMQRLWIRGNCLDRGEGHADRWGLIRLLSEDALVQITERPSIASRPTLALAIAEAWVRSADRIGTSRMEPVMRRATIGLRLRAEVTALTAISADEIAEIANAEFRRAEAALAST